MGLDVNELKSIYSYDTDTHNSEMRTRYQWKYTSARAVGGTPAAFVNGVRLVKIPSNAQDWLQLITDVYNSQTKISTLTLEEVIQKHATTFLA